MPNGRNKPTKAEQKYFEAIISKVNVVHIELDQALRVLDVPANTDLLVEDVHEIVSIANGEGYKYE